MLDRGDVRGGMAQLDPEAHDELVAQHRQEWLEGWLPPPGAELVWRRGFLWEVTLRRSAARSLPRLGELQAARFLRRLGLWGTRAEEIPTLVEALRRWPLASLTLWSCALQGQLQALIEGLPRLEELSVAFGRVGDDGAKALARLGLRGLDLQGNDVGPAGVTALAACSLRALDLSHNPVSDEGMAQLSRSRALGGLQRLVLSSVREVTAGGLLALAASPTLRELVHLDLSSVEMSAASASALARAELLRGVRSLSLSHNGLGPGPEALQALARSPQLGALAELDLSHSGLTDEGARALSQPTTLRSLRVLDLSGSRHLTAQGLEGLLRGPLLGAGSALHLGEADLRDQGARVLAEASPALSALSLRQTALGLDGLRLLLYSSRLRGLSSLSLGQRLGEEGGRLLARSPLLSSLSSLSLRGCELGDAGVIALAQGGPYPNLQELDLSVGSITREGASALARSTAWPRLRSLRLRQNLLGDEGARALTSPALRALRRLDLRENHLTAGIFQELASSLPRSQIEV